MKNYKREPLLIWSRWDLRDQREDPAVRHAFCWDLEYADDEKTGIWWWLELLTMTTNMKRTSWDGGGESCLTMTIGFESAAMHQKDMGPN